jgi:hypothetical protein
MSTHMSHKVSQTSIEMSADTEFAIEIPVEQMYEKTKEIVINEKCQDKFQIFFTTPTQNWINKLQQLNEFVIVNKRLPCIKTDKNTLSAWMFMQNKNYDSDIQKCKYIMKNLEIKKLWEKFIEEYPYLFISLFNIKNPIKQNLINLMIKQVYSDLIYGRIAVDLKQYKNYEIEIFLKDNKNKIREAMEDMYYVYKQDGMLNDLVNPYPYLILDFLYDYIDYGWW